MADPLTRLGISRRPAYELFGTPDTSKFGWSDATRQAVAEDQAMADEAMAAEEERAALEDRRIAREREREAEGLADQFTRIRNPSAREKFFDQNEAALTGSRRYNQLAEIRQRAPSYSDGVLANNLASKIEDPDDRAMFLESVARGEGTFVAQDRVDRSRIYRRQAARLAEVGVPPDKSDEILAKGTDDARVNYAIAQWKRESSSTGGDDTRLKDIKGLVDLLRERMKAEELETGKVSDATLAKYKSAETELERAYESRAFPPASPTLTQTPPAAGIQITPEMEANAKRNAANLDASGRLAAIQEAKNPQQVEFLRRLFAEVPPPAPKQDIMANLPKSREELQKQRERDASQQEKQETQKRSQEAWIKAENELRDPLLKVLPTDPQERLVELQEIWNDSLASQGSSGTLVPESGVADIKRVTREYLDKLKLPAGKATFKDPARGFFDGVGQSEVLRALARKLFFEETGVDLNTLKKGQTAPPAAAPSAVEEIIQRRKAQGDIQ
jgi:hypothetical protein